VIKSSVLQHFVRDWLAIRGLAHKELEPDVWTFTLPKELKERLGRNELALSFTQRALSRHPRSELATVGNPVFDRLLAVAREEGRIGLAFTPPPSPAPRPPALSKAGTLQGLEPVKAEPVYQGIYHFVFTISYPSIEAADEMEVVSVDGGTLEVWAQTPDLSELWSRLERDPRKGRTPLPVVPLAERVMEAALAAFERRMRRRINKVITASRDRLEQETLSIKTYYEQLIEEARNQSRRWSTRLEEREDRVQWLQLEWKRRIQEANEFWRPRVGARLVAVGIQMQPRVAYRYAPGRGAGRATARLWCRYWDEAARAFLASYCADCGRTGLTDPTPHPGAGLLCADCAAKPRLVPAEGAGAAPKRKSPGKKKAQESGPKSKPPPLTLIKGDG
jgi:hypothetical protein